MKFGIRFNPTIQTKLATMMAGYADCYKHKYPTLSHVEIAYGDGSAAAWLKVQFSDLNKYVGVKETLEIEQIEQLSVFMFAECHNLKISEIALFFMKMKQGHFGEFYGVVDPMKIMTAKNKFMDERLSELNRLKRERQNFEREQRRLEWSKTAITYEEYRAIKKATIRAKLKNLNGRIIKRKRYEK